MSTINNISSSTYVSYVQSTTKTNATQSVRGHDGDNDVSSGAGKIGRSNFMSAIEQALGQTLSGSSGTSPATSASKSTSSSSSTQDPQAALQTFLRSLFAALHQAGGQGKGVGGDNGGSPSASRVGHHPRGGSNLAANIQNLLQQLSSSNQSTSTTGQGSSTDAISNLNSSFQNLIDTINKSQGQGASAASPTLQAFLQHLQQDLSSGQNISGAVVSIKA